MGSPPFVACMLTFLMPKLELLTLKHETMVLGSTHSRLKEHTGRKCAAVPPSTRQTASSCSTPLPAESCKFYPHENSRKTTPKRDARAVLQSNTLFLALNFLLLLVRPAPIPPPGPRILYAGGEGRRALHIVFGR